MMAWATGPRPNVVRYNDWRMVDIPPAQGFEPTLPVSVVVPYFKAPEKLARTLAALERQTYPRDLFEIVIVDDGSPTPLRAPPSSALDIRVVRQERRGFGAPRARNNGVRAARHEIVVFLDCDVMPEAELLVAHARWHHVVSDVLTLGTFAYVDAKDIGADEIRDRPGSLKALFSDRKFDRPWTESYLSRTNQLTSKDDSPFRVVTSGNLGVGKRFFESVSGFDESFTRYGAEDTEFGYRGFTNGGLLVPVPDALGWHQGRSKENRSRDAKEADLEVQRAKISNLVAHPGFRTSSPGRIFTVPRHVVTVHAEARETGSAAKAIEKILAGPVTDLVVRLESPPSDSGDTSSWLREQFGPDPRVRISPTCAALDEFATSAFHISVPANADFDPGLVERLSDRIGTAVTAKAVLRDGTAVRMTRTWALHRERRTERPAADFGHAVTIGSQLRNLGGRRYLPRTIARALQEARHIRGPRTGWAFVKWLLRTGRWWLSQGRSLPIGQEHTDLDSSAPRTRRPPALGAEIVALGAQATDVFAASNSVQHDLADRHVDVILADSSAHVPESKIPSVTLADVPRLSVPAVDITTYNPIGWVRNVENRVAALGPANLVPQAIKIHHSITELDRETLRYSHHIEDVRAFHQDTTHRAGTLVRLAASGVPIHISDDDPELRNLLGTEFYDLMAASDIQAADTDTRELISIRLRRFAMRDHSLSSRARQVCGEVLDDPPGPPTVSILLATNRPWLLPWALANVARQSYPRLELVLALHGDNFDRTAIDQAIQPLNVPVVVVRVSRQLPLGSVLNAATDAASGLLLTKMDDDDLYDDFHAWDLVLAHEYSGAELVGKGNETTYLQQVDKTIRRRRTQAESYSQGIAGAAMLISRQSMYEVGGWRRLPKSVDNALINDVVRSGGRVYRTHGAGMLMVRHRQRHTWKTANDVLIANAEKVLDGWNPSSAGISGALPPPPGESTPRRS